MTGRRPTPSTRSPGGGHTIRTCRYASSAPGWAAPSAPGAASSTGSLRSRCRWTGALVTVRLTPAGTARGSTAPPSPHSRTPSRLDEPDRAPGATLRSPAAWVRPVDARRWACRRQVRPGCRLPRNVESLDGAGPGSAAGARPAGPQVGVDADHPAGKRVDELLPLLVAPGGHPATGPAREHPGEHAVDPGAVVAAAIGLDPGGWFQLRPPVPPPRVPHADPGAGLDVRVGPVLAGELAGGQVVGIAVPVATIMVCVEDDDIGEAALPC